jgi:phosphatidylserine/phosphatidylglycerophosphate/cardiolipin synthase-like enzyme
MDSESIELLFSDPVGVASPGDRCEAETCTRLLELIRGARSTIDFAVYGMRNQTELLEALEAAQARGVTVRGVVDRDRDGQNYYTSTDLWVGRFDNVRDDLSAERDLDAKQGEQEPFEPPCERPLGFEGPLQCLAYDLGDRWLVAAHASQDNFVDPDGEGGPNRIMHDKFFVVDDRWVWTGSSNISDSGTGGYNANIVALVDSPQLAAVYSGEFEQMWSGRFHTLKEGDGIEHLDFDETEAAVWFSPQDDAMRFGVEALIAQAGDRIDIAVFYLTNKYVTADLIAAHRRGVEVRVIVDATSAKNGYSKHELLREAGIPVKVENWGGKMHMKAAAIDGSTVVVGSMNWTRAGEDTNDENTLILGSSVLAAEFETFFDHLWDSIPEEWGQLGTRPDPESAASSSACMDGVDNDFDGLADGADPGCGEDPPPLPALPPHWILEKSQGEPSGGYRLYEGSTCDPSYPDPGVCIPPISRGDLDCPDVPYRSFTVLDPDPHGFDRAGDGLGCES